MKSLMVLIGLVGAATCWAPQPVQDTPEVAAAKAAHLAALAKAKQAAREKARSDPATPQAWNVEENAIKQETWKNQWAGKNLWNQVADPPTREDDGSWKDDKSWQNYDDGTWVDPETTSEPPKVENNWRNVGEPGKWTGPIALPPGYDESGAPLPVEDTPEVAAAKAKHLQAYVRMATKLSSSQAQVTPQRPTAVPVHPVLPKSPLVRQELQPHRQAQQPHRQAQQPHRQAQQSHRPAQQPHQQAQQPHQQALQPHRQAARVVPRDPAPIYETDGFGDTPEVAAARAAHFAAHAKIRS